MIHLKAEATESVIGVGTNVWQFASVIRGARIGHHCTIASGACIDGASIGDGCIIGHNAVIGPGVRIEAGVFIGPNVTLCNDAWPRVAKDGFDAARLRAEPVILISAGASIGANSVVLPGVWIGPGAMVAAGSVVDRDVPGGMLFRAGEVRPIRDERQMRARRIRPALLPVDCFK